MFPRSLTPREAAAVITAGDGATTEAEFAELLFTFAASAAVVEALEANPALPVHLRMLLNERRTRSRSRSNPTLIGTRR